MNILSSKQFENRLAENSFSETSKYRVLLVSQLIFWLGSFLKSAMNLGIFSTIHKIVCLILVFIGIKACYSINKRIDNTAFIERFTLLFFPIYLKFFLFFLLIFALTVGMILAVFDSLGGSHTIITEFKKILPYFMTEFMIIAFFFMLYRSFIRLEQKIKKIMDKE